MIVADIDTVEDVDLIAGVGMKKNVMAVIAIDVAVVKGEDWNVDVGRYNRE